MAFAPLRVPEPQHYSLRAWPPLSRPPQLRGFTVSLVALSAPAPCSGCLRASAITPLATSPISMLAWKLTAAPRCVSSEPRVSAPCKPSRRSAVGFERDLHDGAQQRLIALRIHLGLAAERVAQEPHAGPHVLNQLAQEAQQALDELRRLVQHPYPHLLKQQGLASALRATVAETSPRTRLHTEALPRYHPDLEAAVYFTCLEALQNASKHAGPQTAVAIRLYTRPGQLCFEISDSGPGFQLALTHNSRGGLANMRDRIGAVEGDISILSTPAHGTTVLGSVPSAQITV